MFIEKIVERMHYDTLHGALGLATAAIREQYWVPKLRSLVKIVRRKCNGCMCFRAFDKFVSAEIISTTQVQIYSKVRGCT